MTSVFDQDVNIDGSTGVWFKDDYVVTNRSSDRITVLDVRSYLTANEAIDDSLIAGIGVSYLGLFRLRSDTGAITLRLSAVPTSFTADQDFTPEVESVLVVAVKTGDRQIAVELGSDTDNPYTNMDVVSYVGDDDWDGTQADAIDRFITYNVGREDDATVVLIKSDHVEFQAATLEFAAVAFTGSEISGAVEASTGEPTASATAQSETVNEVSGAVEASTVAPTASVTAQSEQVGETSGAVEASTGEPEASVTAQSEGATEVSGAVEASTVAPTASVTAQAEGVDRFPFLSRISNQFGVSGGSYSYVLPEVTSGNPPFTYSIHNIPSGFSFNSTTRTLTGTLPDDDVTITYRVEDDDGDIFDREFVISILDAELEINEPSSVVATPGEGYIDLAWDWTQGDFPTDNLRALVFEIQYKHKKEVFWTEDATVEFGRRTHRISDLALGLEYDWRIKSVSLLENNETSDWVIGESTTLGDLPQRSVISFDTEEHLADFSYGGISFAQSFIKMNPDLDNNFKSSMFIAIEEPSGFHQNTEAVARFIMDAENVRVRATVTIASDIDFSDPDNFPNGLQTFLYKTSSRPSTQIGQNSDNAEAEFSMSSNGYVLSLDHTISNVDSGDFIFMRFITTLTYDKHKSNIRIDSTKILSLMDLDTVTMVELLPNGFFGRLDNSDPSDNRVGSYAKYFTFTLTGQENIVIDLESVDFDTYLYLLDGNRGGDIIEENDDIDADENNYNSQIIRTLSAGTYTVEATSHGVGSLGDFILQVS